jgi:arylsulfatase A-like enzyme
MEIYAGFLAQTDKEIDRLADTIKDTGQWDNTFLTGKSRDRSHLEDLSRSADLKSLPLGAAVLARDRDNDSKPRTSRRGKRPWHFRSGL